MSQPITLPRSNKGLAAWARNHGLPGAWRGESFQQYRARLKQDISARTERRIDLVQGWIASTQHEIQGLEEDIQQGQDDPANLELLQWLRAKQKQYQAELATLKAQKSQ